MSIYIVPLRPPNLLFVAMPVALPRRNAVSPRRSAAATSASSGACRYRSATSGDDRSRKAIAERKPEPQRAWKAQPVPGGSGKRLWVRAARGSALEPHGIVDDRTSQRLTAHEDTAVQ